MNTPNKLSILRVLLIPPMVILLYLNQDWARFAALGIFMLASFTDFLDGHIARKQQIITDFGKFIDPLADKLLVLSALIALIERSQIPAWFVIIILARELAVDGLRLIAVTQGKVIAAGMAGKIKTTSQMILIIWLMASGTAVFSAWPGIIMGIWTILITLYSGIQYFMKNKSVFFPAAK